MRRLAKQLYDQYNSLVDEYQEERRAAQVAQERKVASSEGEAGPEEVSKSASRASTDPMEDPVKDDSKKDSPDATEATEGATTQEIVSTAESGEGESAQAMDVEQ